MKFRELFEARRKTYEGIAASTKYKEIEADKNKRVQSNVDYDGKEVQSILTKKALYYVYFDYEDAPMLIIENPNNKDLKDFKDSLESS